MRTYSLNGIHSKDFSKGTHRFAVIKALETLKNGTAGEIIAQVKRDRSLSKSEMDPAKAVHWMIAKMFTEKQLKGEKIKKAPAAKKPAKKAKKAAKKARKPRAAKAAAKATTPAGKGQGQAA